MTHPFDIGEMEGLRKSIDGSSSGWLQLHPPPPNQAQLGLGIRAADLTPSEKLLVDDHEQLRQEKQGAHTLATRTHKMPARDGRSGRERAQSEDPGPSQN
eukprot:CAMPEP_0195114658 /NCGR_PEP_ID=MMETSP0448-20130528/106556_1 /TAXON_ID=66468 /ORGANISM="Heterocapsa triquestra, Strain CCMP 448" /LENGTH=99 /DNA_ID=CAMNT_0040151705 /DNA_START=48 /DNA_END=345 /DNA_ORIENTATION=-